MVGTRPQIIKLAAVHNFFSGEASHSVIDTGQHYDPNLSVNLYHEFSLPAPRVNLGAGSGTHSQQTSRIMESLERPMQKLNPDWVLTFGDTNSTIAAALVARKLGFRVAHLEAGMRSFNRDMPEEVNRVATDHLSDLCLAATLSGLANLEREGLASRSVLVGDVMVDLLKETLLGLEIPLKRAKRQIRQRFVATIHRAENTIRRDRLVSILSALNKLPFGVDFYVHPRLANAMKEFCIETTFYRNIQFENPLPYASMLEAVATSLGVVTDSGGLQKEAFVLQVPCVTLRAETEWIETVDLGWNLLAEPDSELISDFLLGNLTRSIDVEPYGSGNAAELSLREILARAT